MVIVRNLLVCAGLSSPIHNQNYLTLWVTRLPSNIYRMTRPVSDDPRQPGDAGPAPGSSRRRWFGLAFISVGVAMIIVDATIVNVALPSIIDDLRITSTDAQWVQEVYTLVFAALLLTLGRAADVVGRRRIFLFGVVFFAAASVLAAFAASGPWLIGARVLQGFGGAMILPTSLSLLNAEFRGRERGIAFAIWGSTIGGTAALGPLLGGWLTTSFSWRWAFGINVPIGLIVLVGALLCVRESREQEHSTGTDLIGALLSVIGFAGIVFGLIEGRNYGWWVLLKPFSAAGVDWDNGLSPVPITMIIGVVALGGFVLVELRRNQRGAAALLDLRLFRIASFRNGNIAAGIVSLGEFGLLFALPLWFQAVLGYTAFQTGLALLPLAVGSFVASGLASALIKRWSPIGAVRLGIGLEIAGILGTGLVVRPAGDWWETVPALFVYGMGVGLATAQLTGVVLAEVPVAQSGQGSGTQSTSRQIGSALGIAILGTVLFAGLGGLLDTRLAETPGVSSAQRAELTRAVTSSAGAAIPGLTRDPATQAVAEQARDAFTDATRYTAFTAAGFLVIGLIASRSLGGSSQRSGRGETATRDRHHVIPSGPTPG